MENLTNLWEELERKKKLPSGPLTQSCQAELQELMRQLDIMLSSKKREWERDMEALQGKLDMRDQELRLNTSSLRMKTKESDDLHNQMEGMNKMQKEIVQEYEGQLIELRSEVHKIRNEYEKLHRKYSKQTKVSHRMKEDISSEITVGKTEISRLKEIIEEYHHKSKEWDHHQKTMRKEMESLEAQKRAVEEKSAFIQQQSETYKKQLDRRRQLEKETESSLKNDITQLVGRLERDSETYSLQQQKITSLKASLSQALSAHERAMNDNETLLEDVKKANHNLRALETEKSTLESELESRNHLLRAAQEDSQQYYQRLSSMEQSMSAKDDIIKNLGDGVQKEESEKVANLQESLEEARNDIRNYRRKEKKLKDDISLLENKLKMATTRTAEVRNNLQEKDEQLYRVKNIQIKELASEIQALTDELSTVKGSHNAQLDGMKVKLSELTTEVHRRDSTVITLNERLARMECEMRENSDRLNNKLAELKVASAEVESLRVENRHLRHDVMDKLGTVYDKVEAEHQLQFLNDDHLKKITKLEHENGELREDVAQTQRRIANSEKGYHERLQANTVDSVLTIQGLQADGQRERDQTEIATDRGFSMMQDYMDSTVRRHHDQVHILESQKQRLEAQLQMEKQENRRLVGLVNQRNADVSLHSIFSEHSQGTNLDSSSMSLVPTLDDIDSPSFPTDLDTEEEDAETVANEFLAGEQERMNDFERLIDSRLEEMITNMDDIVKKHHHRKQTV